MSLTQTADEVLPATGSELRDFRDEAGVQQQVLAMALGLDGTVLSKIESGMRSLPEDLPARYVAEVRRIARERAEAVGAVTRTQEAVPA